MDSAKLKVLCGELEGLVSRIKSVIDEGGAEKTKEEYIAMNPEDRASYDKNQVMSKGKETKDDVAEGEQE